MRALKLTATVIIILIFISCGVKDKKNNNYEFKEKITVAYFHGERRCETCIAVGNPAKITVEENYKNNKDVCFAILTLTGKRMKPLPKNMKLQVPHC